MASRRMRSIPITVDAITHVLIMITAPGDKLLLLQEADGSWSTAFGEIKTGETPEQAARRVVQEATCKVFETLAPMPVQGHCVASFQARSAEFTPMMSDAFVDHAWVTPDQIAAYCTPMGWPVAGCRLMLEEDL